MKSDFIEYINRLHNASKTIDMSAFENLLYELKSCILDKRQIFICGNGGSGANAIHMENDYLYGIAKTSGEGARITALTSNTAVVTCLGNDIGYEEIFSEQLKVKANPNDILIVLSGSGNSPNILSALKAAAEINMKTIAILGYNGGQAKTMADIVLHAQIADMQISEDLQTAILHSAMQSLNQMFLKDGGWN